MTLLPAPPAGVHLATTSDLARNLLWTARAMFWDRLLTRRTSAAQWVVGLLFVALFGWLLITGIRGDFWPLLVVLVLLLAAGILLRAKRLRRAAAGAEQRMYMLDDRTALLTITTDRDYWTIADHNRALGAPGAGGRLRALLLPVMAAAVDDADVGVRLVAADRRLAARYAQELPGLLEVGPAFPFGIQMYRPSRSQRAQLVELDNR